MAYAGTMVFTGIYQQLPEVTGVWTKTSDVFVTNGGNVTTSPNHKKYPTSFRSKLQNIDRIQYCQLNMPTSNLRTMDSLGDPHAMVYLLRNRNCEFGLDRLH